MVDYNIDIGDLVNGSIQNDPIDSKDKWIGTGIFDKLIMSVNENLKLQYDENRITAEGYGSAYASLIQSSMQTAIDYMLKKPEMEKRLDLLSEQIITETKQQAILTQNVINLQKQALILDQDRNIKEYENLTLQLDQHNIALKQIDKAIKEATMLTSQNAMIVAQTSEIAPNAAKQRLVQDGQIAQMTSEVNYTNAKKIVMEESRIDNLALETLKAQSTNNATVGAGGLTPSTNDFAAANSLRSALYERARGGTLPGIIFTAGTAYTKAT